MTAETGESFPTQVRTRSSRGFRASTAKQITPGRLERMWRLMGLNRAQWNSYFGVSGKELCKLNPGQTEAEWLEGVQVDLENIEHWEEYLYGGGGKADA